MNRKRLTDEGCKRLKPVPGKQLYVYDAIVPRLMLRLNDNSKSWTLLYYVGGKPRSRKLGEFPAMTIKKARDAARAFEEDPQGALARAQVGSFGEIAEQFRTQHVKGLRSARDVERYLDYMLARWRHRPFLEIGRYDVNVLLDEISAKHSPSVADGVLATVSKLFNWFAIRHDNYRSPLVRGMSRAKSQARERILTDDEVRAVWAACDDTPIFGDLIRVLLLTGQRRAKVADMRWDDISEDGVWSIRAEDREKGNAGQLKLPEMALEIIARQPRFLGCDYVFPGRGGGPIAGFNKRMAALRAKLPEDMPQWQLHDLRRTARSLLSDADVLPHVSERVLGHKMPGVEGVYDRHSYRDQKAEALRLLAAKVEFDLEPARGQRGASQVRSCPAALRRVKFDAAARCGLNNLVVA